MITALFSVRSFQGRFSRDTRIKEHFVIKRNKFTAAIILLLTCLIIPKARAAEVPRTILKTFFETGDIPSGQDFKDLIDSALNLVDDGLTIYRVGADSFGHATRLDAGTNIDGSLTFMPASSYPILAPNWLGQSGFLPLELRDTAAGLHYGFLQLEMASGPLSPPPGSPGPAISAQFLVYESNLNTHITTFVAAVPEPTSVLVFGCIVIGGIAIRRWLPL